MTLSVRTKITLGTLLVVAVGLLMTGWLVLRSSEQLALDRIIEDLEPRARLARISLEPLLKEASPQDSLALLQAKALELSVQAGARVTIIAPNGDVYADSATPVDGVARLENHGNHPEVLRAWDTGRGTTIRLSELTGHRLLYMALPIAMPGSVKPGVIRLALPLSQLDAQMADLKKDLVLTLGFASLCSLFLSLLLAKGVTRPLSEMAAVVRRITDGALDQRIQTKDQDEVGRLASTLNQMADQLEARIQEVSEDRAQLRAMLTAMVEGVMVLDARGTVLQINPALERMLLTAGLDLRGRTHWEVIRHHELNELARKVLEERRNTSGEIELAPSGRTFQVEASVAGGQRENEACVVLVFHDVTALRRLEKIRKDFVANVSHELRTPLTSIQGYTQVLKDGAIASPEQAGEFLDIILRQSERLNLILEDLLQLSHIEYGNVVFKQDPVSLRALAERSIAVVKTQAEKNGHTLTISIPEEVSSVLGDEDRLVQVLTNLLDNAVKYTPPHGHIAVTARLAPRGGLCMVDLMVTDTGIGIPESDRPRVFERFYRVDRARSRELGGTGLGLSIVKHIVEGHSGAVWVEGNRPTGSCFVVRLPATAPDTTS